MKMILKNIGLMGLSAIVLILVSLWVLRFYTNHDDELVEVPLVTDVKSDLAIATLKNLGLEVEISDTTFKDGAKKLSVINQNPSAGLKVKKGRTIYLVINSNEVPMVEIPDLAGKTSLTQARSILSRNGLQLGRVIEKPCDFVRSRSDEPVIGQLAHGDSTDLQAGSLIERNSKVDLVICVPMEQMDTTLMDQADEVDEIIELH